MSDAMTNNMATPRSAALERRRALSQNGSAALAAKQSTAAQTVRAPAATGGAGVSGKALSRARREALSQGRAAQPSPLRTATSNEVAPQSVLSTESQVDRDKDADGIAEHEIDAVCAMLDNGSETVPGTIRSAVRKLCQERRSALSSQGKKAAQSFAALTTTRGARRPNAMGVLNGRDAARARREEACQRGRGNDPACRPSGRVRAAVAKVETGTTLRGTGVTGTQVERNGKVTGVEPGSCRAITGTEYIGTEQYSKLCSAIPAPAPAKIGMGTTSRGQRVSGTEVGRSLKVTGDERGTGKAVTGTEYLSIEQFDMFGENRPTPAPAKVGLAATRAGQNVSGSEVGRSSKVTGDEPGSCHKLTGSQYVQALPASVCRSGSGVPHKVSVMSTLKERPVTGTDLASGDLVTGGERGICASVTGTESGGLAQYQGCNRKPVAAPEKIGVMRTWHDQQVSGTTVEHNAKVTGDEYGGCQPISGTEYIGPDQYQTFCDAERQAASRALMASRGAQAGIALSGTRVGSGGKVTGAERGESQVLSGTPYSNSQQPVSQRGANSNPHPLARGAANAVREAAPAQQAQRAPGNFSISTPARSAQDSSLSRITGTAYGAIGRITGPVNLAAGLVSGTPEFRYQDGAAARVIQPIPAAEEARNRLTGDGREGGFAVTGAAWRRNESVTGTEGTSTRRNPTMRGDQRGALIGAAQLKGRERPDLPISKITGSSGNDAKGAAITYSGGARG